MPSTAFSSAFDLSHVTIAVSRDIKLGEVLNSEASPEQKIAMLREKPFKLFVDDLMPLFMSGEVVRKSGGRTNRSFEFAVFLIAAAHQMTAPGCEPARKALMDAVEPGQRWLHAASNPDSIHLMDAFKIELMEALRSVSQAKGGSEAHKKLNATFESWMAAKRSFAAWPDANDPISTVAGTSNTKLRAINDCFGNMLSVARNTIDEGFGPGR